MHTTSLSADASRGGGAGGNARGVPPRDPGLRRAEPAPLPPLAVVDAGIDGCVLLARSAGAAAVLAGTISTSLPCDASSAAAAPAFATSASAAGALALAPMSSTSASATRGRFAAAVVADGVVARGASSAVEAAAARLAASPALTALEVALAVAPESRAPARGLL